VQIADLRPTNGASSDHIAIDWTVIRINGQQFWPYAAVNPETNGIPARVALYEDYDYIDTAVSTTSADVSEIVFSSIKPFCGSTSSSRPPP
jgi:hypothetical protein